MCRVRGRVGLPVDTNDLTFTETTQEATIEATESATEIATEAVGATDEATVAADATDEATDTAADEATEAATEATDEATEAATAAADQAASEVTGDATAESLDEILDEATEPAEVTEAATAEATVDATAAAAAVSEGDGYLFLIQGSGSAAIMRARGRNLTPLVNWQASNAINVGPVRNHLQAVCAGNYLAFYVNETLVAEATDDTYAQGQVGLVASAANRLGTRIEFDDLTVSQAISG
jgi:hypothetical protein